MTTALAEQIARIRDALQEDLQAPLREILPVFSFYAYMFEGLWRVVGKLADYAIEGRKLTLIVKESLDSVNEVLNRMARARELPLAATPGDENGQGDLEACERRVVKVRDDFQSLLHWLDAPTPPVDLAALERAKTGKTESLDSILARLRAGGEL
jgi:hypothetical protein